MVNSHNSQIQGSTYLNALKAQLMRFRSEKGQVAVEYILLVALSVGIAVLITSLVVSRNSEDPGILTKKWRDIISVIATDRTAN